MQAEQEVCEECPVYRESGIVCKEIARTAILALKEIQQYREIGTVEECKELASMVTTEKKNVLSQIVDEWKEYIEIGTVEECREAVEKQKPKKPFEETVEIGKNINEICSCPNCGCDLTNYKKSYWLIPRNTYCYNCGQAIKWRSEI